MPIRWVICPVDVITTTIGDPLFDEETGLQDGVAKENHSMRRSRVSSIKKQSPGVPHLNMGLTCWISDGQLGDVNDWCVVFVRVRDATAQAALDADSEIIDIFEQGFEDTDGFLNVPLDEVTGWNPGRMNRFKNLIEGRGADITGLTNDSPLWAWIERLADLLDPGYMRNGDTVELTDPSDGKKKGRSWKASDQRAAFGEKRIGLKPKGTWVKP